MTRERVYLRKRGCTQEGPLRHRVCFHDYCWKEDDFGLLKDASKGSQAVLFPKKGGLG